MVKKIDKWKVRVFCFSGGICRVVEGILRDEGVIGIEYVGRWY